MAGGDTISFPAQLHPTLPFAYYYVELAIETAGAYKVSASVQGTPIRASPLTLSIQPTGPAASFSLLAAPTTMLMAGDDVSFEVELKDEFGNLAEF